MEPTAHIGRADLSAFVAKRWGTASDLLLQTRPLRGGLEASAVLAVEARFRDGRDRARREVFVAKLLRGEASREAGIYEALVARRASDLAPALLGVERLGADRCLLFLERIRPVRRWPWGDTGAARSLMIRLARLHTSAPLDEALPAWNYEEELRSRAAAAVAVLAGLPRESSFALLRRGLPPLRRIAERLPEIRRQLFALPELGRAVLHGDVHPGNAMMRRFRTQESPILLDWGRARIGSPLEDVGSWLQSLGFWEPEARRRHDTLFTAYLAERGLPARADRTVRDAYWIAAASNVLAGALLVHVWTALDRPAGSAAREQALRAALDALRVIRRADACWSPAPRRDPPSAHGR